MDPVLISDSESVYTPLHPPEQLQFISVYDQPVQVVDNNKENEAPSTDGLVPKQIVEVSVEDHFVNLTNEDIFQHAIPAPNEVPDLGDILNNATTKSLETSETNEEIVVVPKKVDKVSETGSAIDTDKQTHLNIRCYFCNESFTSKDLACHAAHCPVIQDNLPKDKCQYCPREMPLSWISIHQLKECEKNPALVAKSSRTDDKYFCHLCNATIKIKLPLLQSHVSKVHLKEFTKKSMLENQGIKTNFEPKIVAYSNQMPITLAEKTQAAAPKQGWICYLCGINFKNRLDILTVHGLSCWKIQERESNRQCRHCDKVMLESKCLIHEVCCTKNPDRKEFRSTTTGNIDNPINCPKCSKPQRNFTDFRHHLACECLPVLKNAFQKSKQLSMFHGGGNRGEVFEENGDTVNDNANKSSSKDVTKLAKGRGEESKKMITVDLKTSTVFDIDGKVVFKLKPTDMVTCFYCKKAYGWNALRLHTVGCLEVQKRLPIRECKYCLRSLPESKWGTHVAICFKNPHRVSTAHISSEKAPRASCPNCKESTKNYDNLRRHLSFGCLKSVKAATVRSMIWSRLDLGLQGYVLTEPEPSKNPDGGTLSEPPISKMAESALLARIAPDEIVKCIFCTKTYSRNILRKHGIACSEIEKLEPLRDCRYCRLSLPMSKSCLHQATCDLNPGKIQPKGKTGLFPCPKCGKSISSGYEYLRCHLAFTCLEPIKSLTRASLKYHLKQSQGIDIDNQTQPQSKANSNTKTSVPRRVAGGCEETISNNADRELPPPKKKQRLQEEPEVSDNGDGGSPELAIGATYSVDELNALMSEVENIDTPVKDDKAEDIPCPYCLTPFESKDDIKEHAVFCPNMKMYEPKGLCRFCKTSLPVSLRGLHEIVCSESPAGLPVTSSNLDHTDLRCPNRKCARVMKMKDLPSHMSSCLVVLSTIMSNALENSSFVWNETIEQDFVETAGLTEWLKACKERE